MRPGNPINAFMAAWEPCYRHPARRAQGSCEACGRAYCASCLFPDHLCAAPLQRRRQRHLALWLATGIGIFFLGALAGSVFNLFPDGRQPEPTDLPAAMNSGAGGSGHAERLPDASGLQGRRQDPAPAAPGPVAAGTPTATTADGTGEPTPPVAAPEPTRMETAGNALPAVGSWSFNRGPLERRAILFTFDAGSHRDGAQDILDTLAAAGVRTTFFLTGEFIRDYPDLVRRMDADGHEIGNHTETHLHLTRWEEIHRHETRADVTRKRLVGELTRTNAAFRAVTGHDMAPLWRAPYGEYNREILGWAAAAGWRHVGWTQNLDTLDWVADPGSHLYRSADEIADRLLTFPDQDGYGARGAIVLMHLGSDRPAGQQVSRVLPRILAGYEARGFEFLTASDMMRGS